MSSYVLDRDLLGSARHSSNSNIPWIDAHSNQMLIGSTQFQRNENDKDMRKMVADVSHLSLRLSIFFTFFESKPFSHIEVARSTQNAQTRC